MSVTATDIGGILRLRSDRTTEGSCVEVVVDVSAPRPRILHWGADLGETLSVQQFSSAPVPHSFYEENRGQELVPQASAGWRGRPALEGHRADGSGFSPNLVLSGYRALGSTGWAIDLVDLKNELTLSVELELSADGMLRTRSILHNLAPQTYQLLALWTSLPTGLGASEVLDLTGRWSREQHPQRQALRQGSWLREYRHGRTGHDSAILTAVGTAGFANRTGRVWATHLGFSGNHATLVEQDAAGPARVVNGELLSPGEVRLQTGEQYTTPWTYAAYSDRGLDGISDVFHTWMRARDSHPRRPRPVVLNTWEAVYFDHDLDNLLELARVGAEIGVERFVLDDGWFQGRRNDSAGLGDWYVDEAIWPGGLGALIEGVKAAGMEFGLWVEPEMVNEDSDVIRAHPDWISGPGAGQTPPEWRRQQVIDLVNPDAWAYVFDRIDRLLVDNDIAYLKWDQNRDLPDLGHAGIASTHEQTLAAYRLIDALRAAHPSVEIESCSSGGARVDLGILERTDRVWASDCNDALERQSIQRWTQLVVPPELVGSHVGPTRSHTTQRVHSIAFRSITAMFGHFGVEWDVRAATPHDVIQLTHAVALYKEHRSLIHTGVAVHADVPDPAYSLYGTVAKDRSEALYAFASVATSRQEAPGRVGLPGLDPAVTYDVRMIYPEGEDVFLHRGNVGWIPGGMSASGALLGEVGIPMPIIGPEQAILIRVTARDRASA